MDIKTKLNAGDTAFLLHDNKVVKVRIDSIQIDITKTSLRLDDVHILYRFDGIGADSDISGARTEPNIFATKEELLASL